MVPVPDRIFRGYGSYGGRARSIETARAVFQLLADSLDDHHRDDHDRHGSRKHVGRKTGGQGSESGQTVQTDTHSLNMDRGDTRIRQVCDPRDLGTADSYYKQQLPHSSRIHIMHDSIRVSAVPFGNGDAFSRKVFHGQYRGERADSGNSQRVQHDRKHHRNVHAHFRDDPGCGDCCDIPHLLRDTACPEPYIFLLGKETEDALHLWDHSVRAVRRIRQFRQLRILEKRS